MDAIYIVYHEIEGARHAEAFDDLDLASRYERAIHDRRPWLVAMPVRTARYVDLVCERPAPSLRTVGAA